jgi:hypothetical protein
METYREVQVSNRFSRLVIEGWFWVFLTVDDCDTNGVSGKGVGMWEDFQEFRLVSFNQRQKHHGSYRQSTTTSIQKMVFGARLHVVWVF